MTPVIEKRLLQAVVALACLVPVLAGSAGILHGAAWLADGPVRADLDSHFRYLSGIFFGVGLAFVSCIPAIETKRARLRMLAGFVVLGGLARALSALQLGLPGPGHSLGLAMELGVVPLLVVWQARVARRYGRGSSVAATVDR
jgi:Domain of unknown function (DUF4345)